MSTPSNVIASFFKTATRRGDAVCIRFKHKGCWQALSWQEVADAIRSSAAALREKGVRHGDRVAVCAPTSAQWTIADCAIMSAGAITVPMYSSLPSDRLSHIIKDSLPSLIFVDEGSAARLKEAIKIASIGDIPTILIGGEGKGSWSSLAGVGISDEGKATIDRIVSNLNPSDIATIVYTSGTTGEQKGVVLTHGNISSEVGAAQMVFNFAPHEIGLVCLPLAHVLGRLMQFYQLTQGCQAAYAESIDRLAESYREVRPHFVCGVPRMLEKIVEALWQRMESRPLWKRRLFAWSVNMGHTKSELKQWHRPMPLHLGVGSVIADILVFRRIRAALGGRLSCFICGGAPLKEEIARFFHAAGVLVLEGYGLTETFAAATANRRDDYHFGTVGKAFPEVDIRLAPDSEILIRGPTVFREYRNKLEETREAFDNEGWFRTGDMGEYTRDGFLKITGRKKEMIITAGGKNVAPQMIEELMSSSPYINHFMVYGDGHKFLTALVSINEMAARDYLKRHAETVTPGASVAQHPRIKALIGRHIEEKNKKLAPFETIKRFAILDDRFSVETGELTPTLKVRRAYTSEKYKDILEELYRD